MFPRGATAQNATNFGIPKRGNFGIPKWAFFFTATRPRLSAARHPTEKTESAGGSPITALSTSTPA
ncbi:hypothetical protein ELI00_22255 [Rhizobium ruizarguesonis]|nr:hypothetical protein ELI00_22255 [Rhizobium ruizarguesonis]